MLLRERSLLHRRLVSRKNRLLSWIPASLSYLEKRMVVLCMWRPGRGRGGAQLGFLCYSKVTFSASKRVSSWVSVMYVCIFCATLNNLAPFIYVISNCHTAITCITGSIKVNKMITREYLSSAKEWTLELFSKRVLSLSWWFCYTFFGQCRSNRAGTS